MPIHSFSAIRKATHAPPWKELFNVVHNANRTEYSRLVKGGGEGVCGYSVEISIGRASVTGEGHTQG